ncbi:hypothetical protein [Klebsiella pneumoniae]|uniref:hypothetical protein n=1 Tax=Klebsiella pneumoniae TaxID=573 RepID=UPI000DE716D1|nr:hypothetical protein [Klebsiella pneumoniae]SSM12094.1 Uncharacterised protein [Klebsiella pneumoniae]
MTKHTKHAREFNYSYGVSKIVSVELSSTNAAVGLSADGGETMLLWMDIKSFFELKAAPGKWLVDGYGGERFVVDDAGLSKLGEEVLDEEG